MPESSMTPKSWLLLAFLAGCAAPPPPPAEHPVARGSAPAEFAIAAWDASHVYRLSFHCRLVVQAQQVELVDNMEKAPCHPARPGFNVSGCIFSTSDGVQIQVMRTAGWTIQTHERMHLASFCETQNVDVHHADAKFWAFDPSNALHE